MLSYRVNNRKRMMTLGTYGVLMPAEARKLARRELAKIETGEQDPLEQGLTTMRGATAEEKATAPALSLRRRGPGGGERLTTYARPETMSENTENLVLEHLRAIRAGVGVGDMKQRLDRVDLRLSVPEQTIGSLYALSASDREHMQSLTLSVERIERRLELNDG